MNSTAAGTSTVREVYSTLLFEILPFVARQLRTAMLCYAIPIPGQSHLPLTPVIQSPRTRPRFTRSTQPHLCSPCQKTVAFLCKVAVAQAALCQGS